jgi:hypothetical protein
VDYLALHDGSSGARSSVDPNGMLLEVLFEFARAAVISRKITSFIITPEKQCMICLAEAGSRLDQRVEHGLKIECRAADDLQHVGGGGLLL